MVQCAVEYYAVEELLELVQVLMVCSVEVELMV